MRRLTLLWLVGLALVTPCLAQEAAVPKPVLLPLMQALDGWMDTIILIRLAPLKLTDAQLATFAALYQQHPFPPPDVKLATDAAAQVAAIRQQLLKGEELKPADQEALGKALQQAFKQFDDNGMQDQTPVTELTAEEKLVWGVLTVEQQKALLGMADGAAGALGDRSLQLLKRLRTLDEAEWAKTRDRLAELLAAQAGAEGTPARANAKQMVLDYLNRVRAMTDADFAAKQKELAAEAGTMVPAGSNLAEIMREFDPTPLHQTLVQTLLNPRMPALLEAMVAARKKPAAPQ